MGWQNAVAWTPEMDSLLGTMPDARIGRMFGFSDLPAARRRRVLGIPSFRSTLGPQETICGNCGRPIMRKVKSLKRSKRLFCSRECADAGQKRRDSETLRYGPGWRTTKHAVRARDKACRCCGKTPEANRKALHVHHLKPYRFGGSNQMGNLIALCDSCHHKIEAMTERALALIRVDVTLEGSCLTITAADSLLLREFVAGVDSPTKDG